jgi:phosphomannomutase
VTVATLLGLEISYVSEQEAVLSLPEDVRRVLFDGVYAVCRLAEIMAKLGVSIEDIAGSITPGHVRVREIGCDWEDVGRVIGGLYGREAHASEGLRFDEGGRGHSYIYPHTSHPKIIIRTEGDTEEFASELCEKYTDMVKHILKQQKDAPTQE